MMVDELGDFAPIFEIVGAIFLIHDTRVVEIDQGHRPLPIGNMDRAEITIEHQNIATHARSPLL
jgi:hypothetical protein